MNEQFHVSSILNLETIDDSLTLTVTVPRLFSNLIFYSAGLSEIHNPQPGAQTLKFSMGLQ